MTTLAQLKNKILRLLDDPDGEAYDSELMADAVAAAHKAILPWQPKLATQTFIGDGTTTAYALPTDFYQVDGVCDETGLVIPPASLAPRQMRGANMAGTTNDWLEYPSGYLSFSHAINRGDAYTLYYQAQWAVPTSDSDALEVPEYLITAICLYASAYCMFPAAAGASEYGQYKSRIDSGRPTDNPVADRALFLLKLFEQTMSSYPSHIKGSRV